MNSILARVRGKGPLVSVIIPAYNAASTLTSAVGSVFAQSYRAFEVLVIDDGSSDVTWQQILAMGDRVRGLRQSNQGVSAARNAGILAARGDLLALLDADDEWLPQKLERQVEFLAMNPDVALVYSRVIAVDGQGRELGVRPRVEKMEETGDTYALLFRSNRIPTSTVVLTKEALRRVGGFDPQLRITQDFDLWLRVAAEMRIAGLREPLARYRVHGSGLSSDTMSRYREHLRVLERVPLRANVGVDAVARERARAHYRYRIGRLAVRAGAHAEAARQFGLVLARPWRYGLRCRGPVDHPVRYFRALRWYLMSLARSKLRGA